MKENYILLGVLLLGSVAVSAHELPDSTARVHRLNAIEVLGVKQMPSTGSSPVTRINRAEIARLGIDAVKDIGEMVPNLYSPAYGSRMTSSIYMRGLGSRMDQAVVGLSVDGVPYLNKDAYDFDITDISSVEVSRGAQSVLNGRNAMAGQINVFTLSPRDYQGFRAMVEYGRANTAKASAGYYAKLSDKLYSSLTAGYAHSDGFWRNAYNNSKVGSENSGAVRWKTVFFPSAWHSITNTASFSISRQGGYPYASVETGKIAYNDTCYYRRNVFSDGLTVAWAGKRVVVTSLSSVQYIDDDMTLDQDFTPQDYFTLTQRRQEFNFTEDLFAKGVRGNYSWLGGVFGFYRHTNMSAPVTFYDTGISSLVEDKRNQMNPTYPIEWDSREFLLSSDFKSPSGGIALYHESKYSLGAWTFEAGLRWDIEHVSCNYHSMTDASYTTWHILEDGSRQVYSHTPVDINDSGNLTQTFNQLLPKITATYNFYDNYAFASFSKGYKAGGFNTQMFSDVLQQRVMSTMGLSMSYSVDEIVSYRPEKSFNYEAGVKMNLLGRKFTAEAVGFYIDCRDRQLTVFPPGMVTGRIMTNAGRTRSVGVELTARYNPIDDVTLSASYGYTNAVFTEYNNGKADYSGNRVPYAPAHTLFASALWRMPTQVAGLTPVLNLTLRGVGDIMWDEANSISQPFYAMPGASLAFEGKGWSFKLWGENLTNTKYDSFYFVSMSKAFVQRGNPITFGATVRLNIN